MANELTFKIIDIEDIIHDYKHGHISEQHCLDKIQLMLRGHKNQFLRNIKDITDKEDMD